MKNHIKAFLLSVVFIIVGIVLSRVVEADLSDALVEQSKAISYFVTLAGIVTVFSWYKRKAVEVEIGELEVPTENVQLQKRVYIYLLIINFINAGMLILSTEQSIQLMAGISLIMVVVSPVVFRTMQEKDKQAPVEDNHSPKDNSEK